MADRSREEAPAIVRSKYRASDGKVAPRFLGYRDDPGDAEREGNRIYFYSRAIRAIALEKGQQRGRVERFMCLGTREGPFLHRGSVCRIDGKPAGWAKDTKSFRNVAAKAVEEVDRVDQQNLVERSVGPRQRAERSLRQL